MLQTWLRSPAVTVLQVSAGQNLAVLGSANCRAAPGSGSARWPSPLPGTYRLADDQVASEGDASRKDGGRHGDVEAEVKQHVPALPRDENGAGREAQRAPVSSCPAPSGTVICSM